MTSPSAPVEEPEELALASEFPAHERDTWRRLVEGVLAKSGALPADFHGSVEDLIESTTYDGITVKPLYTAEDVAPPSGFPGLPPFVRGSRPEGSVATGWDIRQRHAEPDPVAMTRALHADLDNGVSSLWLVVGDGGLPIGSLADVLHQVTAQVDARNPRDVDLAPVVLDPGAGFLPAADALLDWYAQSVAASAARGNLGADPLGVLARTGTGDQEAMVATARLATRVELGYPNLRTIVVDALPYHEAGGSDAQELGCAIAAGVTYLRALTAEGLKVDQACGQLEFRYAATADQFLTIAKLRAARRLWARVAEVSGVAPTARGQRQHAVTSSVMMTRRDPWVNMLRTTLACFGAGVGGADAITVAPFDSAVGAPDDFARRIARNTQSILLDESKLAGVIDPAGGSWYVEHLTDELAKAAWAWFTEIERAGGLPAALASGLVADRLDATWQTRRANIATRTDPITGVSEFPNLAEAPLQRPAVARPTTTGLPVVRLAEEYERLRDRSDAVLAESGRRPTVFLATLGPVAAHNARAMFAANLFQAGGIDTPTAGATSTVDEVVAAFGESGASIACLCGTDKSYADLAEPTAMALQAAGATRVLLAGSPRDGSSVDGYVHKGCDALAVLTDTLDALGVAR
jgi:methylmalonyl-CoA mutase